MINLITQGIFYTLEHCALRPLNLDEKTHLQVIIKFALEKLKKFIDTDFCNENIFTLYVLSNFVRCFDKRSKKETIGKIQDLVIGSFITSLKILDDENNMECSHFVSILMNPNFKNEEHQIRKIKKIESDFLQHLNFQTYPPIEFLPPELFTPLQSRLDTLFYWENQLTFHSEGSPKFNSITSMIKACLPLFFELVDRPHHASKSELNNKEKEPLVFLQTIKNSKSIHHKEKNQKKLKSLKPTM